MKKLLCFVLSIVLLIPFVTACDDKPVSEPKIIDYTFTVTLGNTDFTATQINSDPIDDSIIIYTRDYIRDGKYSFTVASAQEGRTAVAIRCSENEDGREFDIIEKTDDVASAKIPVNGFVISIPSEHLADLRVNVGQIVKVIGYENAVADYEKMNYASFAPSDLTFNASRRISMIDPVNDFEDNKIYYISSDFTANKSVSLENVAVAIKRVTTYSYEIASVGKVNELTVPNSDEAILLFTGEYNIAYANHYLKVGERVMLSMLEKANNFSDIPAVVMGEISYKFENDHINASEINAEGCYLFDKDFTSAVTPATELERVDVVIVDNYVVNVAEPGARTLLPYGNGIVMTFVGEGAKSKANEFSVGDSLETYFVEYENVPEKFVEINGHLYGIDKVDGLRQPEGVIVLYTSAYGEKTGTNEYGTEIVLKDGKVTSVNKGGNTEIPEDGYVLSIHKDSESVSYANRVNAGDEYEMSLVGNDYSVVELKVDAMNATRGENLLIVYHSTASTGTNEYGYEIAVDENGNAIAESYNGNLAIPKNGFVLSGHGVNKDALIENYVYGEKILFNPVSKKALIIKTPDLRISAANNSVFLVSDRFDQAKKAFLNVDHAAIGDKIALFEEMLKDADAAIKEFDFEKALALSDSVIQNCEALVYDLIETKGVENRAMWYRAVEKSDEEVKATVERMKMLNVNAVYIETWYEGYCIGNKVDVGFNTIRPDNEGYDVLDGFVRICHENGIEVHAWVQNFFMGHFLEGSYSSYNPEFDKYKDKYLLDCKGKEHFYYSANNNYFIFLNSFDRECRDLVLNVYKEILTKYEVDGLHMDYIRYPELNYGTDDFGYNADILAAFAKETGIKGDPRTFVKGSSNHTAWVEFRCNIITSFVKEVLDLVREQDRDIWYSAATYPNIPHSKETIFQDIVTFAEKGYFDEIFSMSYGADNEYVKDNVKSYIDVTKGNVFYSAGLQAFADTAPLNFAYQLSDVEQVGADGVAVFALNYVVPEKYQNEVVYGAFRTPSVQVTKLSVSASAQMSYVSEKLDNLAPILTQLDENDVKFIKDTCNGFKEFSDTFNVENASVSEKLAWCKDALNKLAQLKGDIYAECGDNDETNAILNDVEDLEYWLTISSQRLEARK